ncbi:unnamed protein product [Tetraodon nigroviridis]|nr:unnamed protein product [Tetraodon nigroviridis]
MGAAVGLLLLLIGLHGSQAQVAGDTDVWTEVKALKTILMEAMVKQTILQKQVDELKEEQARGKTKVAFYAALSDTGNIGPFQTEKKLTYSKVFTNIGNAYNSSTGVFIAPVKGVYSFQFTAFGFTSCTIRLQVYKNNKKIMSNWKHSSLNVATYVTNSLILELEAGDTVHFSLPSGACLYDDRNNYSTIIGFLL